MKEADFVAHLQRLVNEAIGIGAAFGGRNSMYDHHAEAAKDIQRKEIELWNREVDARKAAKKRGGV